MDCCATEFSLAQLHDAHAIAYVTSVRGETQTLRVHLTYSSLRWRLFFIVTVSVFFFMEHPEYLKHFFVMKKCDLNRVCLYAYERFSLKIYTKAIGYEPGHFDPWSSEISMKKESISDARRSTEK
ncbi:hypothetical protein TNCV_836061 [Trichonephila clavipes]|nr:hypothetical protein TNCV_836061 [Trichonephila clavipes]